MGLLGEKKENADSIILKLIQVWTATGWSYAEKLWR